MKIEINSRDTARAFKGARLLMDPKYRATAKKLMSNTSYDDAGNPVITYGFKYPGFPEELSAVSPKLWFSSILKSVFVTLIFVVVGIIGGQYLTHKHKTFIASAVKVDGEVIRYDRTTSTNSKGSTSTNYKAVIRYQVGGRDIIAPLSFSSSFKPYDIGEILPVYYDPNQPSYFETDDFWGGWMLIYIVYSFAIVGGLMAFFIVRSSYRDYHFKDNAIPIPAVITNIQHVDLLGQSITSIILEGVKPNGSKQTWSVTLPDKMPEVMTNNYPVVMMIDPRSPLNRYAILWQPDHHKASETTPPAVPIQSAPGDPVQRV